MSQVAGETSSRALVERAGTLVPLIESVAAEVEATGELPAGLVSALHEARLFRLLLPSSVDGQQLMPDVFFEVIEVLARADASVAWCVGQGCGCSMGAAFLAPDVARRIFAPATAVMASGPTSHRGGAVKVDGGYRVTGHWSLASGIRHSDWIGGHSTVIDAAGKPIPGADGKPVVRTMMFPRSAARIIPNWDVVGLRGTGSDDYEVEDLFVADDHTFTRESPADRRDMSPLYEFTGLNMFGVSFAAVALGLAHACLEEFKTLAGAKKPTGQARLLRDNPIHQHQLGLAEARFHSARVFLMQTLREVSASALGNGKLSREERVRLRMATTWAIHQARDVVDFAYNMAGATSLKTGSGIERRFRDVHAVTQHVQAGQHVYEIIGQSVLGIPVQSNLL